MSPDTGPGCSVLVGDALVCLRDLKPASVDLVLTDPPYSSGGQFRSDRGRDVAAKYGVRGTFEGDNRDQRAFLTWSTMWMMQARQAMTPGALMAVFTDWRQLPTTTDAMQAAGLVWRGVLPWCKKTCRPQKGRPAASSEFVVWGTNGPRESAGPCAPGHVLANAPRGDQRWHPTQKPREVLDLFMPLAGGTVLDPFCGSGSTLIAAARADLSAVGVEMNPDMAAKARLAYGFAQAGMTDGEIAEELNA